MAVTLAVNLEREFDSEVDDEDFTGEVFETIGTRAEFVDETTGDMRDRRHSRLKDLVHSAAFSKGRNRMRRRNRTQRSSRLR